MQTFLPYPDFDRSATCLDPKRLGNQVYRECLTLIRGGWPHHPAARMWRGYAPALARYSLACLAELSRRGRNYPHHVAEFNQYVIDDATLPPWLGDERLHRSHRAALLLKDPAWYGRFGWTERPGEYEYFWPV